MSSILGGRENLSLLQQAHAEEQVVRFFRKRRSIQVETAPRMRAGNTALLNAHFVE
jgi:hypothetical protein